MCLQQQWQQKNDNRLTAKSCSGRSGDNSGRGDGGCGTCGGRDINLQPKVAAIEATMTAAAEAAEDNDDE